MRYGSVLLTPAAYFGCRQHGAKVRQVIRKNLDRQYFDLALSFGLSVPDGDPVAVKALVRDYLAELPAYLWVVDSLPSEADDALLHSLEVSYRQWPLARHDVPARQLRIRLEQLSRWTFWARRRRWSGSRSIRHPATQRKQAARMIAKILGFHDLAIDVACATLERMTYREFLDMLANPREPALRLAHTLSPELAPGHYSSIATTLLRAVDRLAPEGKRLLQLTSLLAPAPIPLDFLLKVLDELAGKEAASETLLAKGVDSVTATALAQSAENTLIVHALVNHTIRVYSPASEEIIDTVTAVLNTIMTSAEDANEHAKIEHLIPHVQIVTKTSKASKLCVYLAGLRYSISCAGLWHCQK